MPTEKDSQLYHTVNVLKAALHFLLKKKKKKGVLHWERLLFSVRNNHKDQKQGLLRTAG